MQLDDLYRRVIMDHYKNPRNRGTMDEGSVTVNLNNPTCGDRISLQLQVEDGIVKQARYTGKGRTIGEALAMADKFSSLMKGEPVEFEEYEDIEALSGVNKFPARIKCATLAWNALRKGVEPQ